MLHRLAGSETMGAHLISYHNIYYLLHLMADARAAIEADAYAAFAVNHCRRVYGERTPAWAIDALASVDITVYPERCDG
jgi:queuine tRNA-ribosyltransferase